MCTYSPHLHEEVPRIDCKAWPKVLFFLFFFPLFDLQARDLNQMVERMASGLGVCWIPEVVLMYPRRQSY